MSRLNQRIHDYLDGTLDEGQLSPEELAIAKRFERSLATGAGALRTALPADFTQRVMSSLPEPASTTTPQPSTAARLFEWFWKPRPISLQFRPAYAMGAAAVLALGLATLPSPRSTAERQPAMAVTPPATSARLFVQFRLETPSASDVRLAGSFTDWQPSLELHETADGVWSVMVPLPPGVHDYTFLIDGDEWVPDPYAPQVDDSFGGVNSRLFLPAPDPVT